MRFDDLARRAAEDIRTRAESGPSSDFADWRRKRGLRTAFSLVGTGLAIVFAISLGAAIGEGDPDLAIDTSLAPEMVTTTTQPRTTTTAPDEPPPLVGILGAGWERLDYGPLTGGRSRMAATWTGEHLFVFGGHLLESQEAPPASEFLQDGYLYDPATNTWTSTGRPPGLCQMGLTRAIPFGTGVLVHGSISIGGGFTCDRAAFYDIDTGTWTTFDNDLFANVSSLSPLADTGEMLIAPGAGLAWDYLADEVTDIPRLPSDAAGNPPGPARAHWTGTEVIVVGAGPTYAWAPGEEAWRQVAGAHSRGVDSAMTEVGLLVVDFDPSFGGYSIGEGSTGRWESTPELPMARHYCQPEVVAVVNTVAIRTCSALLIWDEQRTTWVPMPIEDITQSDLGDLIAVDGDLYSVGRSLRSFDIRFEEGGLATPPTIPIGQVMLDIPAGFELVATYRDVREPAGQTPGEQTVGATFASEDGSRCIVSWTYGGIPSRLEQYWTQRLGEIAVDRPGRTPLPGNAYRDPDQGRIAFLFGETFDPDSALIACATIDPEALSDAATEFAVGLWSPWETGPTELEGASLIVTPQAGPSGTHVLLDARGFPTNWSEWWLIDEKGNAVVEIPSDFPHDNPDFETAMVIDSIVRIPPGTYRFAIDGQIVPGASFTKTESGYPLDIGFQSHPSGGIYELSIENVGDAPIYLSDWWIVDEIPNGIELLLPRSTLDPDSQLFIEPGETLWIHIDQVAGCQPGELLEQAQYSLTYCAEPPAASAEGDSLAIYAASGDLIERVFVGRYCDNASDDPYCGYATFQHLRVAFRIPDDASLPAEVGRWHIADSRLTPNLAGPLEILSIGTFPLREGGGNCAQIPENALEDLGSLDAFISVQWGASDARPRPAEFTYEWLDEQADRGFWECLDRVDRDELYLRFASFSQNDVGYYVIVALGQQADQTVRAQQVLDILNSLELNA